LIASSKWEAAWLFDIMKYRNKETKNKGNQERILMEVEWSFGGASEGRWRGVEAKNGCAQLHAFTRLYTKFLVGIHRRDAETQKGKTEIGRKRTQRTQKTGNSVGGRWAGRGKRWVISGPLMRLFPRKPALIVVSG